mgnify:CR=1 FL=1
MKLVVVKFADPTTFGHWAAMEDVDTSQIRVCVAAGWLVEENDKYVKVALLLSKDKNEANSWIIIPGGCVLSMDEIKEVDWDA